MQKLERRKAELIKKIVTKVRSRGSKGAKGTVKQFVRLYFEHVPPRDMVDQAPENLLGAALSHWAMAGRRKPGEAKVRVYNPSPKKDGWACDHTVVEIVNDDMPFLVDSVTSALNQEEVAVHLVIHPLIQTRRDKSGRLRGLSTNGMNESFMHFEIAAQSGDRLDAIGAVVEGVLGDVRAAVEDWKTMRGRMKAIIDEVGPRRKPTADQIEAREFLQWIHADQFTFLGYRDYDVKKVRGKTKVVIDAKTGLGILRDPKVSVFRELRTLGAMSSENRELAAQSDLLMVTKANLRSTVHRPVHLDSIGIKKLDAKGHVVGLRLFVGLFTSSAYHRSPREIPLLRRKLQIAFDRTGFTPGSHDGKALIHILETFPRDELFQMSDEHLYLTSLGILNLQDRQGVALFIRRDEFERFLSCLVFIPRDLYDTDLRQRIQAILEGSFGGEMSAYYTQLEDSPLARLHMIIQTPPGRIKAYDADAIETRLVDAARSWTDLMEDALVREHGEERGLGLLHRYRKAFPPGYKERSDAAIAIADIACLEHTIASGELGMDLCRSSGAAANQIRFKIYNPHHEVPLSDVLPMLEHMGLKVMDEIPHAIQPRAEGFEQIMIHDFGLETRDGSEVNPGAVHQKFQDAFIGVWRGEMESDGFNGLVLGAGLTWRQVVILRTYCKYLRQAGIPFSQAYMEQTLANHPGLARLIVDLFVALFDPAGAATAVRRARRIQDKLNQGLELVESADEDRILRRFHNVVEATLRTNYFQPAADGGPKPYLSVKLDSQKVDDLPLPRPMVEVFVYSPRVEAIHLRGGKVARGGIRWSDRREDFRTEVLGLMKAQMVKNAVIVPVGAKGGFVVKRPPPSGDREALLNEGIACYKTLVRGLLDISDNYAGSTVVPPRDVTLGDGDDPYLVVAADKGTATFSDIANGISLDYGFWLGDAFASGGSVGYDHKKVGITARGAWESVKRHFREVGTDIQTQDFTVVGVGDMSGDVFGNGMLLSPRIKLVAAFNHLHIFVDPDPDPAKSLKERQRLFALPRSSWSDYNAKLLSKGGAVFDRRAKSITLSAEAAKQFGVEERTMTPGELLGILLRASVDLLWFGGIGTFVKASDETHADAGDRGNDAVRVDATELRCRVIGEGANLGVTQRARVEYAMAGGRLNADSIDNSGGVDCSDHEVNIKILLDSAVASGTLTARRRDALLARMTDEVADLVLHNNYLQSQAISVVEARGTEVFDDQVRMMRMLERAGRLNREVEFLPDDEALDERQAAKKGFTRPEIAVLMPHLKIWLYDELLKSDLPDDPRLFEDLVRYFPTPLQKTYHDTIGDHRLRREIIATTVTNSMINRVGGSYVTQLMEKTGMTATDIAGAYIIARDVFAVRETWVAIEELDNAVPASVQTAMLVETNRLIERGTLWFLRNAARPLDIGANVAVFCDDVATLADGLEDILPDHYRADLGTRAAAYTDAGVPPALALRMAGMVNLASGCDIVRLAGTHNASVRDVAELYFAVGAHFHMGRLRAAAESLEAETHWRQMAVAALIDDLFANQVALASQILEGTKSRADAKAAIASWAAKRGAAVEQTMALLSEVWSADAIDFSMLSVASRRLQALI